MRGPINGNLNMELAIIGVSDCMARLVILYLTTKNETTSKIYRKSVKHAATR